MPSKRPEQPATLGLPSGAELRALKLLALDSTANPIVISKRDGTIIWANEAFQLLSGYSVAEVLGQNTSLLKSGQHPPSFYKTMWKTILSGQRWQGELVNRRKDGSFYQEEMTITPVKSENGEISHFIAIKIDITERKRAEARTCLLAEAVENSRELICITNSHGIVMVVNHALLQATGYEESEVLGTPFGSTLISPNNPSNFGEEILARTLSDGQWRGECLSSRKDRTDFPTFLSTGKITDSQGLLIGLYGISQDITERKRAGATNQTLASALELANDSVMYLDAEGRITYWNDGAANTYGWSREEAVGRISHELLQTIFPKPLLEIKAELSAQGKWEGELMQCCKNGAKVVLSSRWVAHRDVPGHVDGTLEINRDVTERNRLEIQRRRNKDRLDLALEVAGMGEWELDLKNLTATHSLIHDQIFGYPSLLPEWNYAKFLDHVLPQHRSEIDEKFRASQATGIWDFETQIRRVDGEVRWIWARGRRWLDATGQASRMLGTVIDITERKREEGLSRALFNIAEAADHVQSLDDLYKCIHEIIRTIIPADSFYIAFYDEAHDELQFPYYVDEVDLPLTRRKSSKGRTDYVLRTGTPLLLDWSSNRDLERRGDVVSTGKPTATWMGVPLKIDDKTIGVMAAQHYTNPTAFDETHLKILENIASHVAKVIARKRAEEERRVAEERFYKAFHASPIGICISTMEDGVILEVNEAFANLVQYESEELVGKTTLGLDLYVQPEDRMQLLKLLHSEVPLRDFKFDLRTKSRKILNVHAAAESLEVHGVACILVLLRDSTEQEVLERQLRQAQRMEAVGSLSAGVAHDFNNLLSVILGYTDLLTDRTITDEVYHHRLEEIRKAVNSSTAVTRQLLAFSRTQILQPTILDLNAAIQHLNKMIQRLIGENIRMVLSLDPKLYSVKADPSQIEQVLINLAVNARDAMLDGGELHVQTANVHLDQEFVEHHLGSRAGDFIKLSVTDTGTGMEKEVLAHMFEPFFTTKELGKGTGLGLATVYGIIKQSEGYIWVESELGRGSTFEIYLPRVDRKPVQERPQEPAVFSWGSETILLVEDEPALREITKAQLESLGYKVFDARDAQQAVLLFVEHQEEISLLLTDVIMPGQNGRVLAERLVEKKPGLQVLFMSGYAGDEILRHGVSESKQALLSKPFSREILASCVRNILDGKHRLPNGQPPVPVKKRAQ